jgi:hypothetical protein
MAELGLSGLALEELEVVDHQDIDGAQRVLECDRILGPQGGHEAIHELLGGEVQHLALGAGIARPSQRLQQMRLAEANSGMDVEWVEHDHVAAPRLGDLLGGGVRQRVGASDHEGLEGQARVERRAAERLVHGRDRSCRAAQVDAVDLALARIARTWGHLCRLELRCQRADHRRAHGELDAGKAGLLRLPAGQHPLGIVGLDPALEKARRHRQLDGLAVAAVEFQAREPTRIDIVAHLGAKPILHPRPAILVVHVRHVACLLLERWVEHGKRDTSRRAANAVANARGRSKRSTSSRLESGWYARPAQVGRRLSPQVARGREQS